MSAGLFSGPAPRLRAVPASASFLDVVAQAMVDALANDASPFALADALVLAPNQRAKRGLMEAFAKRLGGAALLPSIRSLNDPGAGDDPELWEAEFFSQARTPLAPPLDKMARQMVLAALIRRRDAAEGGAEDPARALALADELARLLDSAEAVERIRWEKLHTLVEEIELARHWSRSARFLEIVASFWPNYLIELGRSDPAAHGAGMRLAIAAHWTATPPSRPIVVAGSTGSTHTTRALMRAVAALPRGVVILPGLDGDLDEASWTLVGDQHPQHALKSTLAALGVDRRGVPSLGEESASGRARRTLLREALAPPERTADWLTRLQHAGGAVFVQRGATGLRLIEAATENEEAQAIAVTLRETLERGRTAALVTPDLGIARRVEAKLKRWGVSPTVSHGTPLSQTEAGRLAALLCELTRDPVEPVALAGLLKHGRVAIARDRAALVALEHAALRGPRRHETLAELETLAPANARALVSDTAQALAPLRDLSRSARVLLNAFAQALAATIEACAPTAWAERDGEQLNKLVHDVAEHGGKLGELSVYEAALVFARLMQAQQTPPNPGGDARIAIWGPMEARLQRRDVMVLGGLNEGVWPAPAPEDPFLSREMRVTLGFSSLDERIGLAAHDFAQLASAPEVVLSRSLRRDGAPTLASRWLWRLETLMHGAGERLPRAADAMAWAKALDAPAQARKPVRPPHPRPPAGKRLARLSVTQVEKLIRDPYEVYARRLLGLEALKLVGGVSGPAERGIAVHKAIERLEEGGDAAQLLRLLEEELRRAGVPAARRVAEQERLRISAEALVAWFASRQSLGATAYREHKGLLKLGAVELSGVADRIEIGADFACILDFKTNDPPNSNQVASGLAPQLPLEAAMLARGAFSGVAKAQATELVYWRFGNAEPMPKPLELDAAAEAEKALASLQGLLAQYGDEKQAFLCKPRVQFIRPYDDYDHLARRKEWAEEGE